jgi:chaperone modulatory protein CbpM
LITIETLLMTVDDLDRDAVERLIALECIRPGGAPGAWLFRDIDVARVRLIQDLRRSLGLQDEALPVVLHLLDQLYATRRRLLRLRKGALGPGLSKHYSWPKEELPCRTGSDPDAWARLSAIQCTVLVNRSVSFTEAASS